MKKIMLTLVLLGVAAVSWAAEIYTEINAHTLLDIMRSEGYSVSLDEDADIIWKKDGHTCVVFFNDGNKNSNKCWFRLGFRCDREDNNLAKATFACNDYNKEKIVGKAYVGSVTDDDFTVCVEVPLLLRGGVTREYLVEYFKLCISTSNVWKKEVVDNL